MPTWKELGFRFKNKRTQCMVCRKEKDCGEVKVVRYGKNPSASFSWFCCRRCWLDAGLVVYNP